MADFVALAATAKRLIDANGRDVTLRQLDRGHANGSQPWRKPGATNVDVGPLKGVIVPFESNDIDGTLIRESDKKALVAANDTGANEIEKFDELIDGSDIWKIVRVKVINPGTTRVLYIIQLRQ